MKIFSNLNLQNSVAQNFVVENLTNDPVSPKAGQFWYNSTENTYKGYNGTEIIDFGSAKDELLAKIIESVGLTTEGAFDTTKYASSNYLTGATSVPTADLALDTELKKANDKLSAALADLGLNADTGAFEAFTGTNYLDSATSSRNAFTLLDTQIKTLDTENLKRNGSVPLTADWDIGTFHIQSSVAPSNNNDLVNKKYVDDLMKGVKWQDNINQVVTDTSEVAAPTEGYRVLNTTLNDVQEYNGAEWVQQNYEAGTAVALPGNNAEVKTSIYIKTSAETGAWVDLGSMFDVVAGNGLEESGNTLSVKANSGITATASGVSANLAADGGLAFKKDGAISSDADAAIAINTDATLTIASNALGIANAGVNETKLAASVAGNGIAGGNGTALSVDIAASSGLSFVGDVEGSKQLSIDTTFLTEYLNKGKFLYTADSAQTTHTITHNIGTKVCSVTIADSNGEMIMGDVTFTNENSLTVTFTSAVQCTVYVQGIYVPPAA